MNRVRASGSSRRITWVLVLRIVMRQGVTSAAMHSLTS